MSKFYRKDPLDKRGKWSDVLCSLLFMVLLYMGIRWIVIEPFVIPSGSMESTLLVQDYVVVKKWSYGLRLPFSEKWAIGPNIPKRGDIVVFKATDGSGNFLVKRVIGLPGESLYIDKKGFIHIDGMGFSYQEVNSDGDYNVFREGNGEKTYQVQFLKDAEQEPYEISIPEGHIFMMGDNRNQSMDSRFWGALPLERIMGKLSMIWVSCNDSNTYSSFLCPISELRKERLFKIVN